MIIFVRMKFSELYNNITNRYQVHGISKVSYHVDLCWLILYLLIVCIFKERPVSRYYSESRDRDDQRVWMPIMQGRSLSLCLMAGASVSLVLMLLFNALAGSGTPSIFVGSVSDSSNKYETSITPAGKYFRKYLRNNNYRFLPSGWAFIIWTPIFMWLAVNLIIINTVFFLKRGPQKEL